MITTFPLLKLFNSENNYFDQSADVLQNNRQKVRLYLKEIKGYNDKQIAIYLSAYDYFMMFPLEFDGATMTEDLYDFENLELCAMLHDYLYISFNASGNFSYCLLVDKLFRNEMTRMNKSSWNRGVRFVLLLIKSPFFVPYTWLFKGRRMTRSDKNTVDGIITTLSHRIPKPWHKEFKGEMTCSILIMILLTFVLYNLGFF